MATDLANLRAQLRKEILEEMAEEKRLESEKVVGKKEFQSVIYHPIQAPAGRTMTIRRYTELDAYFEDGWYDTPAKFPTKKSVPTKTVAPTKVQEIKKEKEPAYPETLKGMVVKLLKGEKVCGKKGLSLVSFHEAYKIAVGPDVPGGVKENLRPLYNDMIQEFDGLIKKKGFSWFYKDKN